MKDYGERLARAAVQVQHAFAGIMEKTLGVETVTLTAQASAKRGQLPVRKTLKLNSGECQLVSVFNSLLHQHDQIVSVRVAGAKARLNIFRNNFYDKQKSST